MDGYVGIYRDCLTVEKYGYPLYLPGDCDDVPPKHREVGVELGDVGCLDSRFGFFDFLFNIDDEDGQNVSQEPRIKLGDKLEGEHFPKGTIIHNYSRSEESPRLGNAAPYTVTSGEESFTIFESHCERHAALLLPDGAKVTKHRDPSLIVKHDDIRLYVERAARDFHGYAGPLILVTEHVKCRSWATYTVSASTANAGCAFTISTQADGIPTVNWRYLNGKNVPLVNSGPPSPLPKEPNQCVFLDGYWIARRRNLDPRKVSSPLQIVDLSKRQQASATFPTASSAPGPLVIQYNEDTEIIVEKLNERTEIQHPCDVLNQYLLDEFPEADIAVTSNQDLLALSQEGGRYPSNETLIERLKATHNALLESGVVSVRARSD